MDKILYTIKITKVFYYYLNSLLLMKINKNKMSIICIKIIFQAQLVSA